MDEYVPANYDDLPGATDRPAPRDAGIRPWREPAVLFVLTCLSTTLVGGPMYALALMAILVSHEMGHFLQSLRYRVPASLPYFIPMPVPPVGTMGAVIFMRGTQADRKQLFDIGLTGPLAGLAVLLPFAWYGVSIAVPIDVPPGSEIFRDPLLFQLLIRYLRPELPDDPVFDRNPYYMAAWVGTLITGLNMLPISQLDGGHTAYALFGRRQGLLARMVIAAAIGFMLYTQQFSWIMMLVLVTLLGIDHPPTADDRVELGWPRTLLGLISLLIPVFCLAPIPIGTTGP